MYSYNLNLMTSLANLYCTREAHPKHLWCAEWRFAITVNETHYRSP